MKRKLLLGVVVSILYFGIVGCVNYVLKFFTDGLPTE